MNLPAGVFGEPLSSPPEDGITRVLFTSSNLLLASSWDTTLRLYNPLANNLLKTYHLGAPVLDCCLNEGNAFAGALDGSVKRQDLETGFQQPIGSHTAGVRCVLWLQERGLLLSGSWDGTLRLWDPRAPPYQNCASVIQLPGKVYTMSHAKGRVVVGCSGRHVLIYDTGRLEVGQPEQQRVSNLKFQTRCIASYPNGLGYALGSVEGRVAMEYFDLSADAQGQHYAFKCHRRTENGAEAVFPVNAIAFHPLLGTFATGGGDGVVNIWDGDNKKRLHQINRYPTSVASLCFNHDGSLLAVASSYTFEQYEIDHPPDAIYVRRMQETEVKPKPKAFAS